MSLLRHAALALILLIAAGCSSFTEEPAAPTPDGGPTSDAGPLPDGGPQPGFCAAKTAGFCDDFERDEPRARDWQIADLLGGATLAIDNGIAQSQSRSLRAKMLKGTENRAFLRRLIDATPKKVALSFAMRLDSTHSAILAGVDFSGGGANAAVFVSTSATGIITITAIPGTSATAAAPKLDQFERYKLTVDLGAATATLDVDGEVRASVNVTTASLSLKDVYVGNAFSANNTIDGTAWFDDVTVDFP